ncbi:hypothetical protein ACFY9Y_35070 [Streptomyces fimicarius]|uniref:hypothetical protein n=1 Tax=Streptomyces griseus TaxID=1911 RepID=UPI0036EB9A81
MSDRKDYIRVVHTSTSRGAIDLVAVERAVNETAPEGMTGLELHEATRILIGAGVTSATLISTQLRVPVATLRGWFPVELAARSVDNSPYVCGTPRAYRLCRRDNGRPCPDCRAANSAKDREYRKRPMGLVA